MAEALREVKLALGYQAVIVHTRKYARRRWPWFRMQEVVEIVAGRADTLVPARRQSPARAASLVAGQAERRAAALSTPSAPMAQSDRLVTGARRLLQTSAAGNVVVMGLSEEVGQLKTLVSDLVRETRAQRTPQIPEEVFEHYLMLVQNQVAQELAADIVKALRLQLRPEHLKNAQFVRDKLAEQLQRVLPVAGPIARTKKTGPHVVALIGPTGVGKTTTVAKLAANLKLREKQRVGLITIDTYRIAATDQLKKYADIIGAPLRIVATPEDLTGAIAGMRDCEYILIDTAGRSPSDTLKLNELRSFIAAAAPDEVHLVLATTCSEECIESAIAKFSQVRVDKIIFTKLDEAVHVGTIFNVIHKVHKSLSYITTGQDVPDDIEPGGAKKLAQLILGGGR